MANPRVLIIGASVRAAAQSARRAGWDAVTSDMFGDTDLREIAEFIPIESYPDDLVAVLANQDLPVIYTGGLENHPALLSTIKELWGNSGEQLHRARDPFYWTALFQSAGITTAAIRTHDATPENASKWLAKTLQGAGGAGVRPTGNGHVSDESFFQEFVSGQVISAVFVGAESVATLLGTTRQLVRVLSIEVPFAYAGSIGPVVLAPALVEQVTRVGEVIAGRIGLRGLFGVDFILNEDGVVPIEINPRYTASVEVLELATGENFMTAHRSACRACEFVSPSTSATSAVAKVILYAEKDMVVSTEFNRQFLPEHSRFADVPAIGTRVSANTPLCTVLSHGDSLREAASRAERLANSVPNASVATDELRDLA